MRSNWFSMVRSAALASLALALCGTAHAIPLDQRAPDFAFNRQGGGVLTLSEFSGRVVLLNVWTSACVPCRPNQAWLSEMGARYGASGLQVVSINTDSHPDTARRLLERYPAPYPIAFDPQHRIVGLYQLVRVPTTYLIGRDGRVLMEYNTFMAKDRARLEGLLRVAVLGRARARQPYTSVAAARPGWYLPMPAAPARAPVPAMLAARSAPRAPASPAVSAAPVAPRSGVAVLVPAAPARLPAAALPVAAPPHPATLVAAGAPVSAHGAAPAASASVATARGPVAMARPAPAGTPAAAGGIVPVADRIAPTPAKVAVPATAAVVAFAPSPMLPTAAPGASRSDAAPAKRAAAPARSRAHAHVAHAARVKKSSGVRAASVSTHRHAHLRSPVLPVAAVVPATMSASIAP